MSVVIIIPARLASTRLPNKILADLHGKPLLWWTWMRSKKVPGVKEVIIAADSDLTRKIMVSYGADVVLTPQSINSGTERAAYACRGIGCKAVLNIQADEPLFSINGVTKLVVEIKKKKSDSIITLAAPMYERREIENPNNVKVVLDNRSRAVYFSRSVIPFCRERALYERRIKEGVYLKHMGVYAYKKDALLRAARLEDSYPEDMEKLEQLKYLSSGYSIMVIKGTYNSIGVDTPSDLNRVKKEVI